MFLSLLEMFSMIDNNHTLVIIRGPSGSGKSTIAKFYGAIPSVNWFEADQYFGPDYKFDVKKLGQAHRYCEEGVRKKMNDKHPLIIVSNTGTRLREISAYLKLAEEFSYKVIILRTPGPWNAEELSRRTIHKVPIETIQKQIDRYTPAENEIEWRNLTIFA